MVQFTIVGLARWRRLCGEHLLSRELFGRDQHPAAMLQVINAIDESEPGFSLAQMRLGSVFAKVAYQFLLPLEHFFVERPAQHFRVRQNLMQFNLESRGLQQRPMIAQRRSVAGWGEVALPIGEGEPRAGFQDASRSEERRVGKEWRSRWWT